MKKFSFLFFVALLMPGSAIAGEKTLYEISRDTISLVEAYTACADPGAACTQDDARALQAAAKSSLADLKLLIASGTMKHMMMTADEARTLSELAKTVREQFMTIELFDAPCNQAIILVGSFMRLVYGSLIGFYLFVAYSVMLLNPVLQAAVISAAMLFVIIPGAIIGTALILGSFVLLAPCLFFWL